MTLEVVILAAGKGTRMRSELPKVLHPIGGQPMLFHVIDTARELGASKIHVVIGHGAEQVKSQVKAENIHWVVQHEQNGTGHAVTQVLPYLGADSTVLVLYGDVPLVRVETLQHLLANAADLGLLTASPADPSGYGRIIRDAENQITGIVEHKDAAPDQLAINEINTGILVSTAQRLQRWLPRLSANNVQGEYYLTDIVAMAAEDNLPITSAQPRALSEVEGINNRLQQANLERVYQQHMAQELMTAGVSLLDPCRIDVRGKIHTGHDVLIDVNTVFEGEVYLGNGVSIGPNCCIKNSSIGDGSEIKANSILEDTIVEKNCVVGPFARLRPGTHLADAAKIGNFVETKKAIIGAGSKVNHLSYIGDTTVGIGSNIGAGTITCNYDGVNKFQTEIGDAAFIGSNTSLVAPVKIGNHATVAAGSIITGDVSDAELGVGRARQRNISNWQRPLKKDL
ncbi:MAG: bifunctional UDP-N-acetylglucosamine diphosphorylase/glucosamine-1-phosphate N-acetyltransferase GlmU [Pseudomonadales bacterium]